MKRKTFTRVLCTILCAAMLCSTSVVALPVNAANSSTASSASTFDKAVDFVFRNFGLIGFILDPYQFTIINQKPVFQWALGFNDLYDLFTWFVNVWADTIVSEFTYAGKDWRIQLWKGGYGLFLATGGEIGIYQKKQGQKLEHYNAPADQKDWLYLNYTIYNKGEKLFSRPSPKLAGDEGPYWWAPGYKILSICTDFYKSPRSNVVMDATIEFKDEKMAKLFIGELKKKGFSEIKKGTKMSINTPEKYQLQKNKKSVRLIWKNINEGLY